MQGANILLGVGAVFWLLLLWLARLIIAQFGSGLAARAAPVRIGFNPQTGAPVFAPAPPLSPQAHADQHWAVKSRWWSFFFLFLQLVVCVLMLVALAIDEWSMSHAYSINYNSAITVYYGVIRAHSSAGSSNYSDICKLKDPDGMNSCDEMQAGAAIIFAWLLIGFAASIILLVKSATIALCSTSPQRGYWVEWMVRAGRVQLLQYAFVVILWAALPNTVLGELFSGVSLGPSWFLTIASFVLSLALYFFYCYSIEYRRDGSPTIAVADAPAAVAPAVAIIQPQQPESAVVVHVQQQQPQPVVAHPQYAHPVYASSQVYPSQQSAQYATYDQPPTYAQAYDPAIAPPPYEAQMPGAASSSSTFPDVTKR